MRKGAGLANITSIPLPFRTEDPAKKRSEERPLFQEFDRSVDTGTSGIFCILVCGQRYCRTGYLLFSASYSLHKSHGTHTCECDVLRLVVKRPNVVNLTALKIPKVGSRAMPNSRVDRSPRICTQFELLQKL